MNDFSYRSISINKGIEDEMDYNSEQMIKDDEIRENIADESYVSSQEEQGNDNGKITNTEILVTIP